MNTSIRLGLICVALLGASCDEGASDAAAPEKEKSTIIRNLPNQDREFLLEPLESALDDLREIVDYDPGLRDTTLVCKGKRVGTIKMRLNGNDTLKLDARWVSGLRSEVHMRYWDENGELFFMESDFRTMNLDSTLLERRAYRVYLEEGGEVISTYGKVGFELGKFPDEWRTICPTPDELSFLLNRPYWLEG